MIKKLLTSIASALFFLILLEAGLECLHYQRNVGHSALEMYINKLNKLLSRIDRATEYSGHMFRDDSRLGYASLQGKYVITQHAQTILSDKKNKFVATIGADGYRVTSECPASHTGQPQVWIFGCSYTWGWSVDDSNSWPWLIQSKLQNYDIKNYSGNGYGTIHALIQLRQLLTYNHTPDTVAIVYDDFHLVRNVAAPSRLAEYAVMSKEQSYHHPKASLDNGQLKIETIPLKPIDSKDPSLEYQKAVCKKILAEIYTLCRSNGVNRIVFAHQTAKDEIVEFARKTGFEICDMDIHLTPSLRSLPFDTHPNAAANKLYAERFLWKFMALHK